MNAAADHFLSILTKIEEVAKLNACSGYDRLAVRTGFDAIMGKCAYDRLVSELYDELRARASA